MATTAIDAALLQRVEDAGLNASAPPQQRWMDGWLVRIHPGKAQRARCVNAVAAGTLPLDHKLSRCARLYAAAGLPLLVRITPMSQPAALDGELHARGFTLHDPVRVMLLQRLPRQAPPQPAAGLAGLQLQPLSGDGFAQAVGLLRGSPRAQCAAHAERLRSSPVPYRGLAIVDGRGEVLACGQHAIDDGLAGLYDIVTRADQRGQGLGRLLCEHLLSQAASAGCDVAYLQVGADNAAALRLYHRLGFEDAYGYHYRLAPGAVA